MGLSVNFKQIFFAPLLVAIPIQFVNAEPQCRLSEIANLPQVTIIGENHFSPSSIEVRGLVIDKGHQGLFPVASEIQNLYSDPQYKTDIFLPSDPVPTGESLSHGIESLIPYSLIESYDIQHHFLESDTFGRTLTVLAQLTYAINRLPYFHSIYEKLIHEYSLSGEKGRVEFAAFYSKLVGKYKKNSDKTKKEYFSIYRGFSRSDLNLWYQNHLNEMRQFILDHHTQLIQHANQNYSTSLQNIVLPMYLTPWDRFSLGMSGPKKWFSKGIYYQLNIQIRDYDFALSAANLICHYYKTSEHLFIIVGSRHTEGMTQWLAQFSADQLEIEDFNSAHRWDLEKIYEKIQVAERQSMSSRNP